MLRKPQPQDQARIVEQAFAAQGIKLGHRKALDIIARLHGHKNWHLMSKASPTPTSTEAAPVHSWAERVDPQRQIALVWDIMDVFSVRPDLSDDEAMHVLQMVHRRHDASQGVTWDTLTNEASYLYSPWLVDAKFHPADGRPAMPCVVRLHTGDVYPGVTLEQLSLANRPDVDGLEGTLEFSSLPDDRFEVQDQLCAGDADELHALCEELRAAGQAPSR